MVKVHLVCVGKLKENYLKDAAAEYCKRLSRFCKLDICELPERPTLAQEGEDIKKQLRGWVFVLAVEGKQCTSEEFAGMIGAACDSGAELTFVIGSSCGLHESVKAGAQLVSFSKMTFPHQLMRVIALEQIYRGFMINAGAEYHK